MVDTAQYCLLHPLEEIHPRQKSLSCYQQTNTHFDSFSDASHTDGPKMKAQVSVLAAEGLLTLEDIPVSAT